MNESNCVLEMCVHDEWITEFIDLCAINNFVFQYFIIIYWRAFFFLSEMCHLM